MADDLVALIRRFCEHQDETAFAQFYRSQADRLWRYLRRRGAAIDDAYDLVGETFGRFARVICKDPSFPKALLYRIAVNAHIDGHRRAQAASIEFGFDPVLGSELEPDRDEQELVVLRLHVARLLEALPESEQNLLLLRYWVGLSHKEVAQVLSQPEGTVRRRSAALIKQLREQWDDAP